jgi:hypothetical protein
MLWGFSKFVNKSLTPAFNAEVSGSILGRPAFAKVPSVSHRLYRKVVDEIINQKKKSTSENLSLSMYACASVNFYDKEFFDNAIKQYKVNNVVPNITELGYIV